MIDNHFHKLPRTPLARGSRPDSKFVVAITTTKIYCWPVCPARKAELEDLAFFAHTAQTERTDYRACLRCYPEPALDSATWLGAFAITPQAIRIMDYFTLGTSFMDKLIKTLGTNLL